MKLIVLMSTYNGEKYLRQQLDSLLNQDLKPDRIIVRDDGSSDDTVNILEEYCSANSFIEYSCGKNLGPGKSFFDLIRNCEEADYYALCDQDDYWFKDKLSTAVKLLEEEDESIPLLYASHFTLTDQDLNPIRSNVSSLYNYSDFAHALIYHSAPGCTFVFNNESRKRVLEYDPEENYFVIHDAIIHKVVTMFGKMILDKGSHIYYRQHGNNEIGMNAEGFKSFTGRISRFLNGKSRNYRSLTAASLLKVYGDECSAENRKLLEMVAGYKKDKDALRSLLNDERFRTHTINDFFFRLLVLVKYI